MELIISIGGIWIGIMLFAIFKIGHSKPARNYEELMKKESFAHTEEDNQKK